MSAKRQTDCRKTGTLYRCPESNHIISVLYCDNEKDLSVACKRYLERNLELSITLADSSEKALRSLDALCYDVVVSGCHLSGTNRSAFLKNLQERGCTAPVIFFTRRTQKDDLIGSSGTSSTSYIQKGRNPNTSFAELEDGIREFSRIKRAENALKNTRLRCRASSGTLEPLSSPPGSEDAHVRVQNSCI